MSASISYAHTGWTTPSLDASVAFWTEVMGFRVVSTAERHEPWIAAFTGVPDATLKIAHLEGLGQRLELLEWPTGGIDGQPLPPQQLCVAHVCVRCADVQALRDRILAAGGALQGDVTVVTEGPSAGVRGLYLRDPCGFLIEVLEAR